MATRKLSVEAARERHAEFMKDPEYAEAWNSLVSRLFSVLADLPEDAIPDEGTPVPGQGVGK